MTEKKLGNEPFFACAALSSEEGIYETGASKRLVIATQLTAAGISYGTIFTDLTSTIKSYYKIADELLRQENL